MVLFSEHCTKHRQTPLTCLHLSLGGAVVQAAREPPLLLQVSRQPVPASGRHRARGQPFCYKQTAFTVVNLCKSCVLIRDLIQLSNTPRM